MRELTRRFPPGSGLGAAWHAGGTGRRAEWLQRAQGGLEWCKRRPGRQKGADHGGPCRPWGGVWILCEECWGHIEAFIQNNMSWFLFSTKHSVYEEWTSVPS